MCRLPDGHPVVRPGYAISFTSDARSPNYTCDDASLPFKNGTSIPTPQFIKLDSDYRFYTSWTITGFCPFGPEATMGLTRSSRGEQSRCTQGPWQFASSEIPSKFVKGAHNNGLGYRLRTSHYAVQRSGFVDTIEPRSLEGYLGTLLPGRAP